MITDGAHTELPKMNTPSSQYPQHSGGDSLLYISRPDNSSTAVIGDHDGLTPNVEYVLVVEYYSLLPDAALLTVRGGASTEDPVHGHVEVRNCPYR
jgi:hypothetical protein